MKVLHVIAGELSDGAARGAYWLHLGLKELSVDSKVFTSSKITFGDNTVVSTSQTKKGKILGLIREQSDNLLLLLYPARIKIIFSSGLFGANFIDSNEYKEADIIHLHWVNKNFLNIKHLSNIEKPIVWTMRDMWPFTGGCHVAQSLGCNNYKSGCGNCVQLNSNSSYDLSRYILNRKKKYLPKNMRVVGVSSWLSNEAKNSDVFKGFDIRTIHNNVDTSEFIVINKIVAKNILGIKTDKKIISVGSTNINDPWKGFDKFLEALKNLDKDKYFLCFFGVLDESFVTRLGFEYKKFGYLYDNISLRLVYSCANVFVAPTLLDAFGKTLAEAMACGTPVVCFDATGPKDIVSHKLDGYKAIPYESTDLAKGIEWVINYEKYDELCENARNKAFKEFDNKVIAKKYMSLYSEILSSNS